jgi:hypothetical protein
MVSFWCRTMRYEVYGKWNDPIKEAGSVVRRARTPLLVVDANSPEEATREAERGGVIVEEVVLEIQRAVEEGASKRLRQVIEESVRPSEGGGLSRRLPGLFSADLHRQLTRLVQIVFVAAGLGVGFLLLVATGLPEADLHEAVRVIGTIVIISVCPGAGAWLGGKLFGWVVPARCSECGRRAYRCPDPGDDDDDIRYKYVSCGRITRIIVIRY